MPAISYAVVMLLLLKVQISNASNPRKRYALLILSI